ncbi:hypothetical protein LYZ81_22260, partial [Xanthomonas hortorum]|nr:hypothetical protein [Xanthomonas hortorum]
NYGRRLKALKGLTPYEFICKQWTSEPERFKVDPIHLMPGLNTYVAARCIRCASPVRIGCSASAWPRRWA